MKKKQQKKPKVSPGQLKALVKIANNKKASVSRDIVNTLAKRGFTDGWNLTDITEKGYTLLRNKNIISKNQLQNEKNHFARMREKFGSKEQLFKKKL